MLDFTRTLTSTSALSYAYGRLVKRSRAAQYTLKSGPRFELRDNQESTNNDYGVAYEVFVHDYYNDHGRLKAESVHSVVDLGANVGFSVLYFLHRYPHCIVTAFEPHPQLCSQALRNLAIDGNQHRAQLYQMGAGARTRFLELTDSGSGSSFTSKRSGTRTIRAEVIDIFPMLASKHIDLLKMDIEGGEYEILSDPRFSRLDIGAIVMEWHIRGDAADDKRWCEQTLVDLGFAIEEIFTRSDCGMFWAFRRQ